MKIKKLSLSLSIVLIIALFLGCVSVLAPTNLGFADSGSYYSSITATSGTALLGQLHDLIVKTHTYYSTYNDCRDKGHITDPGKGSNTVMEFYTHIDIAKGSWDVSGGWNREHVWPKSLSNGLWKNVSGGDTGAGADLHHIRPAEKDLNNDRGNLLYGEVSNGTPRYTSVSNVLGGHSSGNSFEPLDNVKGDVARIIMYVYTHYNNASAVGGTVQGTVTTGNLPITNIISASNANAAWDLLLKWNRDDPVDDIERARNEAVYNIQHNRNPFIDNENYADAIWGGGTLQTVDVESISLTPNTINLTAGESAVLNVNVTPSNASKSVTWSTSNSSVATVSNGTVTATGAGTAVITATSTQDNTKTATATVSVKSLSGIEVTGAPQKTLYNVGDRFDPTGLTVKAIYSDGSNSEVSTSSCDWLDGENGGTALQRGTTTVECRYKGKTATVSGITVKALDSITISGTPTATTYVAGQKFDPTGLTVTAHFSDNTSEVVANAACQWVDNNGSATLTNSSTYVVCKYGSITCDTQIDILIKQLQSIILAGSPLKTEYILGDKFDSSGITVVAVFNDDSQAVVSASQCSWVDEFGNEVLAKNATKVICQYVNKTAEITSILVKEATSLEVSGTPTKTIYSSGQAYDPSGLTVTLKFDKGSDEKLSPSDCQWKDNNDSATVTFATKWVRASITINGKTFVSKSIDGIAVESQAIKVFEVRVQRIGEVTDHREKLEAIKSALETYKDLSADEKVGAGEIYEKLEDHIAAYNDYTTAQNNELSDAIQTAVVLTAQMLAGVLAALYVIGKRFV